MESLLDIPLRTLVSAGLGGILPTILWLRFWWRDDSQHNHGKGLLILTFIAGMISVMIALPLEHVVAGQVFDNISLIISASTIEELLKFIIVALVAFSAFSIKGPTDYALYLITGALGFAALENTLFLVEPIMHQNATLSLLTGNLRFVGATVLHSIASASIGVMIGLAYYQGTFSKWFHGILGILTAIGLHSLFNFFIMKGTTQGIITILALVWVSAIMILVVFEKLKQLEKYNTYHRTMIKQSSYV